MPLLDSPPAIFQNSETRPPEVVQVKTSNDWQTASVVAVLKDKAVTYSTYTNILSTFGFGSVFADPKTVLDTLAKDSRASADQKKVIALTLLFPPNEVQGLMYKNPNLITRAWRGSLGASTEECTQGLNPIESRVVRAMLAFLKEGEQSDASVKELLGARKDHLFGITPAVDPKLKIQETLTLANRTKEFAKFLKTGESDPQTIFTKLTSCFSTPLTSLQSAADVESIIIANSEKRMNPLQVRIAALTTLNALGMYSGIEFGLEKCYIGASTKFTETTLDGIPPETLSVILRIADTKTYPTVSELFQAIPKKTDFQLLSPKDTETLLEIGWGKFILLGK